MFDKQLTPKQREKIEKTIAQGKQSFIWKRGVLGWGLPVFLIITVSKYYGPLRTFDRFHADRGFLVYLLVVLPIWLLAGYLFGLSMWQRYNKWLERQSK